MTAEKIRNRRMGPDFIIKCIKFIVALSWIVIFAVFIVFSIAKPRVDGMYFAGRTISGSDSNVLRYAFYLMNLQVLLCAIGIIINVTRLKRKSDKMNLSLIIFGGLSLIGIITYVILRS